MNESSKNTFLPGDIILKLPLNAVYWGRKHIVSRVKYICWSGPCTDWEKWTLGDFVSVSRNMAVKETNYNLRAIDVIEEKLDVFGLKFGMTEEDLELFRQGLKMDVFLGLPVGIFDWGSVRADNCMNTLCYNKFEASADKVMLGDIAMVDEKTFLRTDNLGVGTMPLIKDRFASLGLHVGMLPKELIAMCEEDAKRIRPVRPTVSERSVMVKVNSHGGPIPDNQNGKGDWYDLFVAEDVDMKAGDFRLISMGVSIMVPDGYTAYMLPRSSTFKKFGLLQTNSMGVIDSSYCGDGDIIRFPALATRDVHISKGDRIAQITIMPSTAINWVSVPALGNEDRGGFGSTGI